MTKSSYARRISAVAVILSACVLAACSSDSGTDRVANVSTTVTVVSEDNDQSKLVTELYALALEKSGFRVARRAPVADLAAGYAALKNGAADLFVTYTADALDFLVTAEPELAASTSTTEAPTTTEAATTTTAEATTSTTEKSTATSTATSTGDSTSDSTGDSSGDASTTTGIDESSTTTTISIVGQAAALAINLQSNQIGEILPDTLQMGVASNAEVKAVIACSNAVSTTGYLSTLSDVARATDVLRLAAAADWKTAEPFGAKGFKEVYNAEFKTVVEVDASKIGEAITPETPPTDASSTTVADESTTSTSAPLVPDSDADCGAFASGLDPTIPTDAVVMDDDKSWIRNNGLFPLVTALKYASVSSVIDQVSQVVSTANLRDMMRAITQEDQKPNVIADLFLGQAGIGGG